MSHPKVTRRKRRTETLKKKIEEFSNIFNVNIAVIIQDRSTTQRQTFKFTHDPDWVVSQSTYSSPEHAMILSEGQVFKDNVERLKKRFERLNLECPP
ncbi:hypothetical protein FMEXI_9317 [Fusarium mexicanum]|uniref:MADS-box domain-containing protein n=1 Tax=Fusarium mexicanum TaxID=751941 RepID=A0A8H5IQ00_9HYPO|nr:hypothetical protein FMEXI_9317 [Fusarium mexicanum]